MLAVKLLLSIPVLLLLARYRLRHPAPSVHLDRHSGRSIQVVVKLGVAGTRAGAAPVPVLRGKVAFDRLVPETSIRTQFSGYGPTLSPPAFAVDIAVVTVRSDPAARSTDAGRQRRFRVGILRNSGGTYGVPNLPDAEFRNPVQSRSGIANTGRHLGQGRTSVCLALLLSGEPPGLCASILREMAAHLALARVRGIATQTMVGPSVACIRLIASRCSEMDTEVLAGLVCRSRQVGFIWVPERHPIRNDREGVRRLAAATWLPLCRSSTAVPLRFGTFVSKEVIALLDFRSLPRSTVRVN